MRFTKLTSKPCLVLDILSKYTLDESAPEKNINSYEIKAYTFQLNIIINVFYIDFWRNILDSKYSLIFTNILQLRKKKLWHIGFIKCSHSFGAISSIDIKNFNTANAMNDIIPPGVLATSSFTIIFIVLMVPLYLPNIIWCEWKSRWMHI